MGALREKPKQQGHAQDKKKQFHPPSLALIKGAGNGREAEDGAQKLNYPESGEYDDKTDNGVCDNLLGRPGRLWVPAGGQVFKASDDEVDDEGNSGQEKYPEEYSLVGIEE